jgi:hypothetical protein
MLTELVFLASEFERQGLSSFSDYFFERSEILYEWLLLIINIITKMMAYKHSIKRFFGSSIGIANKTRFLA